jgi:ABC-2 type transport system permease protein
VSDQVIQAPSSAPTVRARPPPSRSWRGTGAALVITAALLVIGWAAYGANIPGRTAAAFVLDVVTGAVVFRCLGFAVASLISTVDAAQPVVQAL